MFKSSPLPCCILDPHSCFASTSNFRGKHDITNTLQNNFLASGAVIFLAEQSSLKISHTIICRNSVRRSSENGGFGNRFLVINAVSSFQQVFLRKLIIW